MAENDIFFQSLTLKIAEWREQESRGEKPFEAFSASAIMTSGGFERVLRGEDRQALDRIEEKGPEGSEGTLYAKLYLPSSKETPPPEVRKYCREKILGMFGAHPDMRICVQCNKLFDTKKTGRQKFCTEACYRRSNQPDDTTEQRKAYRRVYTAFKRKVDERGESEKETKQYLRNTEPYASLIKTFNLPVDSWKGDDNGA